MLSNRVTFYVPSTKNVDTPLSGAESDALIERVERVFAATFGGCTTTQGIGSYVANNGDLIREQVTLVTSYHDKTTQDALAIVIPLAQVIKTEYGQESILIETNDGVDFI